MSSHAAATQAPVPEASDQDATGSRYVAFISYRHMARDRKLAKWLHGQIEQYRSPRELLRRGVRKRVGRVFRDEEELAASSNLSDEIEAALRQSRYLIVVCSRDTPESRWVNEEIARFQSLGRGDRILALLVDGEPEDAFPPALRGIRRASGEPQVAEAIEPLAADVRLSEDESERSVRRTAKLRIIATLLGCNFDDLRQRDQERQRKRWALAAGGLFALLVLVSSLAALAWYQRGVAVEQRQIAVARQLVSQSELMRRQQGSQVERSALLAVEAMKRFSALGVASLEADQALRRAMQLIPHRVTTLQHAGAVSAVAYDSEERLVTVTADGTMRLWDTTADVEQSRLQAEGAVHRLLVSGNGRRVAVAAGGQPIRTWEAGAAQTVAVQSRLLAPRHMVLSVDGSRLATGHGDSVQVWDAATGREVSQASYGMPVMGLALRADGKWVTASGAMPELQVFGTETGESVARLVHEGMETVEHVAFGPPDSGLLATVSMARSDMFHRRYRVSLWDVANRRIVKQSEYDRVVGEVVVGPRGRFVAVRVEDDSVRILGVKAGVKDLELTHEAIVVAMAFDPDERYLATAERTGTVRVWDTATGEELARIAHGAQVSSMAFSARGRWLATAVGDRVRIQSAVAGDEWAILRRRRSVRALDYSPRLQALAIGMGDVGYEGEAYIWRPFLGRSKRRPVQYNHSVEITLFSPDERWLLLGYHDPESCSAEGRVVDVDALLEHGQLREHELSGEIPSCLSAAAFSPDSKRIVAAGYNDFVVRVWEAASGKPLAKLQHDRIVSALAISRDGQFVATADGGGFIRLWDDGKEVAKFEHEGYLAAVAFGPHGRRVVSGGQDGSARIWDVESGGEVGRVVHGDRVIDLAFSPDGRHLATAGRDGKVILWVHDERRKVAEISHGGPVETLAFAPDGGHAVSGSEDGTVRVWTVPDGVEVARMQHREGVSIVRFTPDGMRVLSGDYGGVTRVSSWLPADLLAEACLRIADNLSTADWKRFLVDEPYGRTCPNLSVPEAQEKGVETRVTGLAEVDHAIQRRLPALETRLALRAGRVVQAVATLRQARALDPTFDVPVANLNQLCWQGGLTGLAELVSPLCERAVALLPGHGGTRDSRGLVRAPTGDFTGAIEDFRFYLEWAKDKRDEQQLRKREEWIQALQEGRNPFDAETLMGLYTGTHAQAGKPSAPPAGKLLNADTGKTYETFREAIKEAGDGHRLLVGEGEFRVSGMINVFRKKALQLIGAGAAKTRVISSDMVNVVIGVQHSQDITIEGMLLTHTAADRQVCEYGVILLHGNVNVTIANNIIRGSGVWGIDSSNPKGALIIVNNVIEENTEDGVIFRGSQENLERLIFEGNTLRNNNGYAFDCAGSCMFGERLVLKASNNTAYDNKEGVFSGEIPESFKASIKASLKAPPKP